MSIESTLRKLKEKGCRTTPLRTALLKALLNKSEPVAVQDLLCTLEKIGLKPNQTTLYRQLDTLVEHGVVERVILNPKVQLFEIVHEHHHHFVCEACDEVQNVHSDAVEKAFHKFEKSLAQKGLSVQKHELTLFGACQACH